MKIEHHEPYFSAIERLLGISVTNKRSYIAENMMFSKTLMNELINKIQSNYKLEGQSWFEKIVYALDPESVSPMGGQNLRPTEIIV